MRETWGRAARNGQSPTRKELWHLERVEPVRPFRPVETDIVELVRIPVPFNEVVGGTGIVRILEAVSYTHLDVYKRQALRLTLLISALGKV